MHPSAALLEQISADQLFEIADVGADDRLANEQVLGRVRERLAPGHFAKDAQLVKLVHAVTESTIAQARTAAVGV
jgi:hypothetical protein